MPNGNNDFMPTIIPPLEGLVPVKDDDGQAFETQTHSDLVHAGLETIVSVARAAQSGKMPITRALGLIQGTSEHYRNLANLYTAAEPEFEKDDYGNGGLRRRRQGGGGLGAALQGQGLPGELSGMITGQTESANISALTGILKSDASEVAKAVARARLDVALGVPPDASNNISPPDTLEDA
jgi:hypothetical protein